MVNNFNYKINNPNNIIINTDSSYNIIPIGTRCTTALATKYASIRKFSLPFDWTRQWLFPNKIQNVLENEFENFIPDVHNGIFLNKYGIELAHFNKDINEGIQQYKRRIKRFNSIIKEDKKIFFIFTNEDYLYTEEYRNKNFNDKLFREMLDLELYLKLKYPTINFTILYFNFLEHKIPSGSNIINYVLSTKQIYHRHDDSPFQELRNFIGLILSNTFKTVFNPGYNEMTFNEE